MRRGRIINILKLLLSYFISIVLRKPIHCGHPAHISVEPTNRCNLGCPECPTGQRGLTRPSGTMEFQDFRRFIDQFSPHLAYLTLYFQGEPYLNKDLFCFISYARSRHIYVWSSTNGHYLTEENIRETIDSGLSKLVISLDGTDQKAYGQYRVGGSFETVTNGIRNFVRIRKEMGSRKPFLEIQFLVLKSNEHQVQKIRKLGNSLGVDRTVLKTAQFYDFKQGNPLMPEEGKWSRYKRTVTSHQSPVTSHHITTTPHHHITSAPPFDSVPAPRFTIKNPLSNRCFRMWSGCVITWDGKVVPCCFDKDAMHCLGDLKTQSFQEIWHSAEYKSFRRTILNERRSMEICRNCSQRW